MSARAAAATDNGLSTYIIDEGSHNFRTELPNLIDDLGLSVYAHRLYTHIKRRAGADDKGACTAGLRGMAKSCGMSLGMAAKARQELLDFGLIRLRVEIVRHKDGGGRFEVLTVADIWPANFTFYARREQLKPFVSDEARAAAARAHLICLLLERGHQVVRRRPAAKGASPEFWGLEEARAHLATFLSDGVHIVNTPPRCSLCEQGCSSHGTPGVSPHEHKKEPVEERTIEEHTHTPRARATAGPADAGVCGCRKPHDSEFCYPVRKAHAEANGLGSGWLTNSRDGRYDELIADALAAKLPKAAERRLVAAPAAGKTYADALTRIGSLLRGFPGADIGAELDRMGVNAETRAAVLDYFAKHPTCATPNVSTHDGMGQGSMPAEAAGADVRAPVTQNVLSHPAASRSDGPTRNVLSRAEAQTHAGR